MAPRARQSCKEACFKEECENPFTVNYPLDKVDDVVHGGVAGDPLVQVSDNVHADVTQEVLGLLCLATGDQGGEEEQSGGELHHHAGGLLLVGSCEILDTMHVHSGILYLRKMSFYQFMTRHTFESDMCSVSAQVKQGQ